MEMDTVNLEIIRQLQEGRKSFKKIASLLDITENTVRSRVNKLTEEGILSIAGNVDIEAIKGHQILYLGVKLSNMELEKKGNEFLSLKGVISAAVVTGRYDIILQVLLSEEYSLLEFITKQLNTVEGVQTVESFVVYKGFNLKVPYIL